MDLRPYLNRYVILGTLAFTGLLLLITLIAIGWMSPRFSPEVGFVPADLTMIPAPTNTPDVTMVPTNDPLLTTPTLPADTIGVGGYVQIKGTEGQGLRIRLSAGLTADTVFRGEESEVFVVKDGPKTGDNYTWWYLVAPYDETRAGWAVADFLVAVPSP